MSSSMSQKLYIEQDGDQFNDLWTACAVIFGVLIGFFLGVIVLFALRKYFPAKYTRTDAAKLAASGLEAPPPVEPEYEIKDDEEEYAGIVPQDEAYIQSRQVLDQRASKPLSWTRQTTAVDVDANEVIDGVMDALAQETPAQVQLALINQEFNTVNLWEEELQQQYRNLFLNLINISLDGLVQQKVIEPEQKQTMSVEYEQLLRNVEREWKEKLRDIVANYPTETQGDSMLSNDIEQMRYDATMDMEEVMLNIREQLRKDLVVKTMLKPEEIDFMEEKLVENLSNLCEIINNEYQSVEKIHVERSVVARKSALHYFSTKFMEDEQIGHLTSEIEKFMEDLKKTCKVSGGTASKIKNDFVTNIKGINIKYNEEFQQNLHDQLAKSSKDRVSEMKRIKTWKRSTEIASTGNQSYQAAVDGLIEPSRHISTMHDLQKTVRLDRMLARKRIDTREGEIFDGMVNHMSGEKQGEYKALLQDILGTLKLEKGVDHQMLEDKMNKFKDDMLTFQIKTKDGYTKLVDKEFEETLEVKKYLEKEITRQSADQEELLGEQEDAVLEVLQTQSGLSEIEREQMMQVHQHQALSVINMLFMNRIRSMKRVEVEHLQDKKEHDEVAAKLQIDMDAIQPAKAPNKSQQKKLDALKKKHEEQLRLLDEGLLTTKEGALDALRNEIFAITRVTLSRYDERIGELLAKLQVSQARKEGNIVKQTQVLDKIKSKLVDMIWQDGYVPEANCKKVLQDHHKIVQDVSDKFATKKENNAGSIEKSMKEKKDKREGALTQEMNEMVEKYKGEEHSNINITEPLLVNWNENKVNIQRHNLDMEQTRQIQDLFNNVEDEFARELHEEEHNIILELAKMGRLDVNEFDAIIKASVTACVGGDKLYKELSAKLLSKYGQTVKRSDKAYAFWEVAHQGMKPAPNPKDAADRAAGVWRARLGIYDERKS